MIENNTPAIIPSLSECILVIRKQRVIVDADLARLYGVKTYQLNQQVRRNKRRFPQDFVFQLTAEERDGVITNCDHLKNLKYSKSLPLAFTEHGTVMAANVLNSELAIDTSVLVVRAFIQTRELIMEHADLKLRLDRLESQIARRFSNNEDELREIRFLISRLEAPVESKKRPIGFGRGKIG